MSSKKECSSILNKKDIKRVMEMPKNKKTQEKPMYEKIADEVRSMHRSDWMSVWALKSGKEKSDLLQRTAERVIDKYISNYANGQPFKIEPVNVKSELLMGGIAGTAHENSISISMIDMNSSKGSSMSVLAHEAIHVAQYQLARSGFDISQTRDVALLGKVLETHRYRNFGIDGMSTAYIKTDNVVGHEDLSRLRDSLYRSQLIERQAYAVEARVLSRVGLKDAAKEFETFERNALDFLKNRYGCEHFTDQQMYEAIDNAQYCIIERQMPSSYLEASIVYDMQVLIFEQEREEDRFKQALRGLQAKSYLKDETKEYWMGVNGYSKEKDIGHVIEQPNNKMSHDDQEGILDLEEITGDQLTLSSDVHAAESIDLDSLGEESITKLVGIMPDNPGQIEVGENVLERS